MADVDLTTADVKKLKSDVDTLKALVFSNDAKSKVATNDLLFLKSNVVNKASTTPTTKFLRGDRTWQPNNHILGNFLILPMLATADFPAAVAGEVHIFANSVGQVLKQYENGLIEELVSTDYAGPGAAPGGVVGTFDPINIGFID